MNATPTIFLSDADDERLYIACKHLDLNRTDFITRAIMNAILAHENKHGGIMEVEGAHPGNLPGQTAFSKAEKEEILKKKTDGE